MFIFSADQTDTQGILVDSPYKSMQVYFYQRVTEIGIMNKNLQVNTV